MDDGPERISISLRGYSPIFTVPGATRLNRLREKSWKTHASRT